MNRGQGGNISTGIVWHRIFINQFLRLRFVHRFCSIYLWSTLITFWLKWAIVRRCLKRWPLIYIWFCCGYILSSLHRCHNERNGVSNLRRLHCLLNHLFRRRSKKTSKLRGTGLCDGWFPHKGPVTRKMFPFDDVIRLLIGVINLSASFRVVSHAMEQSLYPQFH